MFYIINHQIINFNLMINKVKIFKKTYKKHKLLIIK